MADNIVKIGTALKWRGVYDYTKKYYQDNIITLLGCVFRCKVLQCQGLAPVEYNEEGHLEYINTDFWDVIVDMAFYYNATYDSWASIFRLNQKQLEQEQDIADLKEGLQTATETNNDQNERLDRVEQRVSDIIENGTGSGSNSSAPSSLVDSGRWYNFYLWLNSVFWNNETYQECEPSEDHQCLCASKIYELEKAIEELKELIKSGYNPPKVTVTDYDDLNQVVSISDGLKVIDYKEKQRLVELDAPNATKSYDATTQTVSII